jgi:RNA polymerase sigma factor (sigma-70 family)
MMENDDRSSDLPIFVTFSGLTDSMEDNMQMEKIPAVKKADVKSPSEYTDGEIISKILAGEKSLFEILIRKNNPFLYKTGRSFGYNHEDTQDLMQETYINAFLHLAGFESRSTFKTWILKIMFHNCYRKKEKFSYRNEIAEASAISDNSIPMYSEKKHTDPTRSIVSRELGQVIERSLQTLPLEYRMVFSLREISGLNVAETAEAMDISESNVKVRLNRAKTMLRKEVEKTYSAPDLYDFHLMYCDQVVANVMEKINKL